MADKIERIIADTFLQMAEGLETGNFGKKPKIALTGMGSEHGEENAMEAAKMAAKDGIEVYYIGTLEAEGVTTVKVADDEEGHKKMEELLASHEIDGWTCCDSGEGKRDVYCQYNRNFQFRPYRRNDQKYNLWNHSCKGVW